MNAELMCQYIKFIVDHLLVALGCPKHYNFANPFDFMDMISLQGKTNFFKKCVSDYSKAGVKTTSNSLTTTAPSNKNDQYSHINNTIYYHLFDLVINTYLITHSDLSLQMSDTIGLVTGSRDTASLYAVWTEVSSRTGYVV
jgi:hypothetical protein